ncbi:sigma-54-dependent Fis family transcriptional regulator [Parashewanella spongiae]|uniref:Sigma-54-dependent Fis family transcriptional regulator n=2 Tax=Parashewanella spongiae TaxID=342950 RepID=A0A3A6U4M5_9GAMM|nr:sigma-54 dependent transcriptional regulator [Parashewanella spongiae]MCL1077013.1 sigma-54 dependent transcriptional regulator [Parashewanella spongiae]RJY19118.1 sigma-54-dependent Fis family transcriptional regulator [Parashewanella spongiae]
MKQKIVLVVDDDADIRFALNLLLRGEDYRVIEADSVKACLQLIERITPNLILLDLNFSQDTTSGKEGLKLLKQLAPKELPVMLMTAWANIELVVQGLQAGAVDFIEKPWNKRQLVNKISSHINISENPSNQDSWIAYSPAMQQLEMLIKQLAPTDANLLILGENGTGKSLLAKRIHAMSHRASEAFVGINMAAIPESLFESELFGHIKGAFTDAKQDRQGAFGRAKKGTLFLDEIGTLPYHLQPKLLQVLESGEFTPLGSNTECFAQSRLISATNQNLSHAIEQGEFRQDLYYRLNTFVITLPALRNRQQDILPLANMFIEMFAHKYNKSLMTMSAAAETQLLTHEWAGNVRELSHVIERAVLINSANKIDTQQLILEPSTRSVQSDIPDMTLEALEKQRIVNALEQHDGHLNHTATELGISRNALYRRLDKYQLISEAGEE